MTRPTAWLLFTAALFCLAATLLILAMRATTDWQVQVATRYVADSTAAHFAPYVAFSERLAEGRVACVDGIAVGNPVPSEVP